MSTSFGTSVLSVFDVWEEAKDFLTQVVESPLTPAHETRRLVDTAIHSNAQDFHHLIDCARAMQQSKPRRKDGLDGCDVLAFVWYILAEDIPWAETDSLIKRARELARDAPFQSPVLHSSQTTAAIAKSVERKQKCLVRGVTSRFWSDTTAATATATACAGRPSSHAATRHVDYKNSRGKEDAGLPRPAAGIVARVPFPPLSACHFGLIQEKLAHEPFWLLIAVTFLIKTSGQIAIPAFYRVKERFPSPQHLADAANADELLDMIRHLGLGQNRLRFIQKYATAFITSPPSPDVFYKVRNYDERDSQPRGGATPTDAGMAKLNARSATAEGWEIGHLTQGRYTLDSWRIFCRDELLGRAEDWDGKGREPEFQPEWMRVMPRDKELRGYLRWMWMREGWEWDPETGERSVLRGELQAAVNEGRVEYDERGGLRILDFVRE